MCDFNKRTQGYLQQKLRGILHLPGNICCFVRAVCAVTGRLERPTSLSLVIISLLAACQPWGSGLQTTNEADWQLLCHIQAWLMLSHGPSVFFFFLLVFLFSKTPSLPYLLDLLVYTSHLSQFPGVCLVIIFQPFAFISWHVNLYTTWKMKWGTMRLMLCGWVKSKCQMHSVHDT